MIENNLFDRVNDFTAVEISLASPDMIRTWSYGEVKKPETINYRTFRSEKDGLFCEKIFGPERDWECNCGKYKGIKHKGTVCDRCGVKVTTSRVRRKRMGRIELAAPIVHIWFFKAMPSRLGTLLGMKTSTLERIIYYQDYVVTDPGDTPLKLYQMLEAAPPKGAPSGTKSQYQEARDLYGAGFKADMGAEAIRTLLTQIDLAKLAKDLAEEFHSTRSKQKQKEALKRLRMVTWLRDSKNRPEWMVMDVVPVTPPDLRPLVPLDSGNFATSDLNDLYRRLISRNIRLRKLLDQNAPEVIVRNEKRMLQESVDVLFDNARCRKSVTGTGQRPLKSLTDMIKGKQGRFRENLLGKRVDYSARSVIVVGPDLKLHQCGLPKKIALELYQPFIIRRLKERGLADTIKSAKKMLERRDEEIYDILEEVTRQHPVLLNRAPTLHRMGIQAFEPQLIEGHAIRLHPLVCTGFNADFDGDQMAVHLPLSYEAQVEATTLMLSTNNVFSPAHGNPVLSPSQDIVLGVYYLTVEPVPRRYVVTDGGSTGLKPGQVLSAAEHEAALAKHGQKFTSKEKVRCHADRAEVFLAYGEGKLGIHDRIELRLPAGTIVAHGPGTWEPAARIITTVGRVLFNDILPMGMPFYNYDLNKKNLNGLISDCHRLLGRGPTLRLLDEVKDTGFKAAMRAGMSFGMDDMRTGQRREELIVSADRDVQGYQDQLRSGVLTRAECASKTVDRWTLAREQVGADLMKTLKEDTREGQPYLNPIYAMAQSGARGSVEQIRQLAGMRGLMAKPNREIIQRPIKSNFRDGLQVLEYFSSTHGARKGLADTALKTADAGYLTRKLCDVAQNVVISQHDCGTINGIVKGEVYSGDRLDVSLVQAIRGRVARDTIIDAVHDEVVVKENELITDDIARRLEELQYTKVRVRSPLTCESARGICQLCYGMDLSRGRLVEQGLAVGIIAAQSIGEPGTQLTMRTFHIGGTAKLDIAGPTEVKAKESGSVRIPRSVRLVPAPDAPGWKICLTRGATVEILSANSAPKLQDLPYGSRTQLEDGSLVKKEQVLIQKDAFYTPLLSEVRGWIRWDGLELNRTYKEEVDRKTGTTATVVLERSGDMQPTLIVETSALRLRRTEGSSKSSKPSYPWALSLGDTPARGRDAVASPVDLEQLRQALSGLDVLVHVQPDDKKPVYGTRVLRLRKQGPGVVTAADLQVLGPSGDVEGATGRADSSGLVVDPNIEILSKDIVICELAAKEELVLEVRDVALERRALAHYALPATAELAKGTQRGDPVLPGKVLAKIPMAAQRTQDITGGLPRITEVYEARKPRNAATLARIDGVVELGEKKRGKRSILVRAEGGQAEEHAVPAGSHLLVHSGMEVRAGDALVEGDRVPQDVLAISGVEALQDYLLTEAQKVYRAQNVTIDDKHHEIIIAQMLRKVRVTDPGDTELLRDSRVDKFTLRKKNEAAHASGLKPAKSDPVLMGITKASLQSDSFISAASFQETTKTLSEAALQGRVDELVGLKENVILGHLIPAGTGFRAYVRTRVQKNIPLEETVAGYAEVPENLEALKELKDLLGGGPEAATPPAS